MLSAGLAFLISSGSFYWFLGRLGDTSLSQYAVASYYPSYLGAALLYTAFAGAMLWLWKLLPALAENGVKLRYAGGMDTAGVFPRPQHCPTRPPVKLYRIFRRLIIGDRIVYRQEIKGHILCHKELNPRIFHLTLSVNHILTRRRATMLMLDWYYLILLIAATAGLAYWGGMRLGRFLRN